MAKTKKDELRLMPEQRFGELVTAITRVPKPKSEPKKAKPKKGKRS